MDGLLWGHGNDGGTTLEKFAVSKSSKRNRLETCIRPV